MISAAAATLAATWPILLAVAAFGALALVVADVVGYFSGMDSITGRLAGVVIDGNDVRTGRAGAGVVGPTPCGNPHSDKGSQSVSLTYTPRLKDAERLASAGSTGDAYDNAMAESINGLYKAAVIHRKSGKNRAEAERATRAWGDGYNNRRRLERLGHIPPAEAGQACYASIGNQALAA